MKRIILVILSIFLLGLLSACGSELPLEVGRKAPDFTLAAADGAQVSLSDYRGQPVLLFFHMADG